MQTESLTQKKAHPFQNLLFLIRNWRNDDEFSYGSNGGQKYINEVLNDTDSPKELQLLRQEIISSFESITGYLMPHPGKAVDAGASYDGSLAKMDEDFREHLEKVINFILLPKNLITKKINGNLIKVDDFVRYVCMFVKLFQSNTLPEPKNVFDAISEIQLQKLNASYLQKYSTELHTKGAAIKNPLDIVSLHNQIEEAILHEYDQESKMAAKEIEDNFKQSLSEDILSEYQKIKQILEQNIAEIIRLEQEAKKQQELKDKQHAENMKKLEQEAKEKQELKDKQHAEYMKKQEQEAKKQQELKDRLHAENTKKLEQEAKKQQELKDKQHAENMKKLEQEAKEKQELKDKQHAEYMKKQEQEAKKQQELKDRLHAENMKKQEQEAKEKEELKDRQHAKNMKKQEQEAKEKQELKDSLHRLEKENEKRDNSKSHTERSIEYLIDAHEDCARSCDDSVDGLASVVTIIAATPFIFGAAVVADFINIFRR